MLLVEERAQAGRFRPGMDLRADIEALVDVGSVDAWPAWPLAYAVLAGTAVVGSVLSVSVPALGAALALVATLLTFLDAGVLLPTLRRLLGRRASQNVVSLGNRDRPGMLLLVAHYDAGRGGIALGQKAEARRAAFGKLIRRPIGPLEPLMWAELAVVICCVLRLASLSGFLLTVV